MHEFVRAPEGSFFIQPAVSRPIMGIRSSNLNLILTTIMSSYGINFVKISLLVWLPVLLTFRISCIHRILKRVIYNVISQWTPPSTDCNGGGAWEESSCIATSSFSVALGCFYFCSLTTNKNQYLLSPWQSILPPKAVPSQYFKKMSECQTKAGNQKVF